MDSIRHAPRPSTERPRLVAIVGWIWLVACAFRCINGLLGLLVWKVGRLEEGFPFLPLRAPRFGLQIAGAEPIVRYAVPILATQIVVAGLLAVVAFYLLRMKPWARTAIQAASVLGMVLMAAMGVYVYSSATRLAATTGANPEEVRMASLAVGLLIALLGSAFFGTTLFLLSRPAVRRAFERPARSTAP